MYIYIYVYIHMCIFVYTYIQMYVYIDTYIFIYVNATIGVYYIYPGVALISRLLKIIGLFCKRAL